MTESNANLKDPIASASKHLDEEQNSVDNKEKSYEINAKSNEISQSNSTKTNQKEDENYRLAGRKPLITLVLLGIGPLVSQVVSSLYG